MSRICLSRVCMRVRVRAFGVIVMPQAVRWEFALGIESVVTLLITAQYRISTVAIITS